MPKPEPGVPARERNPKMDALVKAVATNDKFLVENAQAAVSEALAVYHSNTSADMPHQNIRHDIDPVLVQAQVAEKLKEFERKRADAVESAKALNAKYEADLARGMAHRWTSRPTPAEQIDDVYKNFAYFENTLYAKVRVIELPKEGDRFILVYGDADDANVSSGTGPFATLEKAVSWFLNGGR